MIDRKELWFDSETTGLNPEKNGIHQFAMLVYINGKLVEEINLRANVFQSDIVEEDALKVSGTKLSDLETFPSAKETFEVLTKKLHKYIDRYNKHDKFLLYGYNVKFDASFLYHFFVKNGSPYFRSYFHHTHIDVMQIVADRLFGKINNLKLITACKHFKIPLDAHDALNDIRATKEVYDRFYSQFSMVI